LLGTRPAGQYNRTVVETFHQAAALEKMEATGSRVLERDTDAIV